MANESTLMQYFEAQQAAQRAFSKVSVENSKEGIVVRPSGDFLEVRTGFGNSDNRIMISVAGAKWLYQQLGRLLGLPYEA